MILKMDGNYKDHASRFYFSSSIRDCYSKFDVGAFVLGSFFCTDMSSNKFVILFIHRACFDPFSFFFFF